VQAPKVLLALLVLKDLKVYKATMEMLVLPVQLVLPVLRVLLVLKARPVLLVLLV
tara:strand:+ start:39 stop:203 length:165 start_codon:yes stop_codon:yes gene_type:complete